MRQFLRRNSFAQEGKTCAGLSGSAVAKLLVCGQVPQMSSDKYLQLDSSLHQPRILAHRVGASGVDCAGAFTNYQTKRRPVQEQTAEALWHFAFVEAQGAISRLCSSSTRRSLSGALDRSGNPLKRCTGGLRGSDTSCLPLLSRS